jgi:hypothetical protein
VRDLRREPGLDQRRHPRRERDVDVDLRQAEEPAVGAHHAEVVRQRQHRAGGEHVPLQRGDVGTGSSSTRASSTWTDVAYDWNLSAFAPDPVEVEARSTRTCRWRR